MNRKQHAIFLAEGIAAVSGLLLACFVFVIPALEKNSHYSARLLLGACMLAIIGLPGMFYYFAVDCVAIYRRHQKIKEIKKTNDERTRTRHFGLLLRSSFCDLSYPPERLLVEEKWTSFGPQKHTQSIPGFYRQLEKISSPTDLRAIKNPDLTGDIPTITYLTEKWQAEIIADFRNSSFIVIVPTWMSDSVLWEISTIRQLGLLEKVVVAMPAALDSLSNVDFAWLNAAQSLAKLGIFIGEYNRLGGILTQTKLGYFHRLNPLNAASFPEYDGIES